MSVNKKVVAVWVIWVFILVCFVAFLSFNVFKSISHEIVEVQKKDTYYLENPKITKHGICAHLMYGQDGSWYVEKPQGFNPTTQMSSEPTLILKFTTRSEAEAYILSKCPTSPKKTLTR